jgi:predicted SnoaL-like aldol condensation-catalyzing enzyme
MGASPDTQARQSGLDCGGLVRMKDGLLAEHWDVLQYEATRETSKSGISHLW